MEMLIASKPVTMPELPVVYDISVMLPAYNEAQRIGLPGERPGDTFKRTLEQYGKILDSNFTSRDQWRLVVVDDGSTDTTARVAQESGAKVLTYNCPGNYGRGAAYRLGFTTLALDSQVVGAYDADGSYPASTIIDQYQAIIDGADMAVACRPDNRSQHESIARAIAHNILHFGREQLAFTGLKDTQAGALSFNSKAALFLFDRPLSRGWSANHEVARIAKLAGMNIVELEQEIEPRGDSRVGSGYIELVSSAIKMMKESAQIGRRYSDNSGLKEQWQRFMTLKVSI